MRGGRRRAPCGRRAHGQGRMRGFPARTRPTIGLPSSVIEPWLAGRSPAITSASSVWPLPATPAMPTISPARTSKRHTGAAPAAGGRRAPTGRAPRAPVSPLRRLARPPVEADRAADHHLHELGFLQAGRRTRRYLLAVPQHGHRVGHLHHLFEMMRDEDHRHALRDEAAQRLEELAALLRREHRRRLVEDDDARAAHQHLQDLDALLDADRKQADALGRIDLTGRTAWTARVSSRSGQRGRSARSTVSPCRGRRCRRPSATARA